MALSSKPTIQEVARLAGVSTATVSRMINNNAAVSAKARARIKSVIEETGYAPVRRSHRASRDARGVLKSGAAALIWTTRPELQHSNSGRDMMLGLSEGLRNINAVLNVDQVDAGGSIPRSLQNGSIDGVFIHGPEPGADVLRYLKKFPIVWLLRPGSKSYGDRVQPHHSQAGQIACRHLLGEGCKHLCCITTNAPTSEFSEARSDAFLKQAAAAGVAARVIEHEEPDLSEATPTVLAAIASRAVAAFAKLRPRPEGLFVASKLGPYVHMELGKRGIVPMRDVRMVAGDTNICVQFPLDPEPVTLRIFSKQIGLQAVEILQLRIKNPDMPRLTCSLSPEIRLPQ